MKPYHKRNGIFSVQKLVLPEAEIIRIGKGNQKAENDDQRNNLDIVKCENGSDRGSMDFILNIVEYFLCKLKNYVTLHSRFCAIV